MPATVATTSPACSKPKCGAAVAELRGARAATSRRPRGPTRLGAADGDRRQQRRELLRGTATATTARSCEVRDLVKHFPITSGVFLQNRSARCRRWTASASTSRRGETLGIVGETGSGKSTTARLMMRLLEPTAGEIRFDGQDITQIEGRAPEGDPPGDADDLPGPVLVAEPAQDGRLDHRRAVRDPRAAAGKGERSKAVQELIETVGLNPEHYNRYPHEFSGGQRQRIGVARALALKPKLLIADEPVSALDVSIQAQVLNLLRDLQREFGLTLIFIAHDLSVVRHMCDRVAVMYLGRIVEVGDADDAVDLPAPSLHRGAARGGAGRRPLAARRSGSAAHRRRAEPGRPAHGVPLPHPLPEGAGAVLDRGAASGGQGTGILTACHFPLTTEEVAEIGLPVRPSASGRGLNWWGGLSTRRAPRPLRSCSA